MKKTFAQSATCTLLMGYNDAAILVLRLLAGGMMLTHGISKILNYSTYSESFSDPIGIGSSFSFLLIMLTESVGSFFVMMGFITRLAAAALVFGMLVAAFIAHAPFHFAASELALLYAAVFFTIMINGGGRYSVDSFIWGRAMGNAI